MNNKESADGWSLDPAEAVTHVSLCAGYGGIDLGLRRAIPNLRTVAFSEIEAFACANLVAKMEAGLLDCAPIWTDVKTFPWAAFRGKVDILSGGYPCQPFSAAGKRLGKDDPRHLWPWIADGIRLMRPRICFFENVEGHISLGLSTVISDLEELDYKVSWGIFSASEVGAPHQRKRVFILAHGDGERGQLQDWRRVAAEQVLVGYGAARGDVWPSRPGAVAHSNSNQPGAQRGDDGEVRGLPQTQRQSKHGAAVFGGDRALTPAVWPSRPGEQQFGWEPPRVVANSERGGREKPEHQQANLPPEPSGCGAEAMGDAAKRKDDRRGSGHMGEASGTGERGDHAVDVTGEAMGDAAHTNRRSRVSAEEAGAGPDEIWRRRSGESGERQTKPPLGRDADGAAGGVGDAELFESCDNRTDELRLLGNGVVPQTAERAWRVLVEELINHKETR